MDVEELMDGGFGSNKNFNGIPNLKGCPIRFILGKEVSLD